MDATPLTDEQYAKRKREAIDSLTEVSAVVAEILSKDENSACEMTATMWHLRANGIGHWLDTSDRAEELFHKCDGIHGEYDRLDIFSGAIYETARAAFRAVEAALGVEGLEDFLEDSGYYRDKYEKPDEPLKAIGAEALIKALTTSAGAKAGARTGEANG